MKNSQETGHMEQKTSNIQIQEPTASELLIQGLRDNKIRKDYTYETQAEKLESKQVVSVNRRTNNNIEIIYLTTEPSRFSQLGRETRLTSAEYVAAVHRFLTEEESYWSDLTMQDMILRTKEYIIAETMIKHAVENKLIEMTDEESSKKQYTIQLSKRYAEGKKFLGEAITVALMPTGGL